MKVTYVEEETGQTKRLSGVSKIHILENKMQLEYANGERLKMDVGQVTHVQDPDATMRSGSGPSGLGDPFSF